MSNEADSHAERVARYLGKQGYEIESAVNISPGLKVPDPRPDVDYGLVDIKMRDEAKVIHVEIELPRGKWEGKHAFDLRRKLRPQIVRFQGNDRADQLWILTHKQYASRLSSALNQIFKWKPRSVPNFLSLGDRSLLKDNCSEPRLLFGWYRFTGAGSIRDIELRVPTAVGRLRISAYPAADLNRRFLGDAHSMFQP